jgi:hypothetical protein
MILHVYAYQLLIYFDQCSKDGDLILYSSRLKANTKLSRNDIYFFLELILMILGLKIHLIFITKIVVITFYKEFQIILVKWT